LRTLVTATAGVAALLSPLTASSCIQADPLPAICPEPTGGRWGFDLPERSRVVDTRAYVPSQGCPDSYWLLLEDPANPGERKWLRVARATYDVCRTPGTGTYGSGWWPYRPTCESG
jgi:hypothetical protein